MFFRRQKLPFLYESEIPMDYTEQGVEKGAKVTDGNVDNPDVLRIYEATKNLSLEEACVWLDRHQSEFDPTTIIVDTDNGDDLTRFYLKIHPKVFIEKRSLNLICHLNTLLNRANEALEDG
jgi:hypothetical protein